MKRHQELQRAFLFQTLVCSESILLFLPVLLNGGLATLNASTGQSGFRLTQYHEIKSIGSWKPLALRMKDSMLEQEILTISGGEKK